MIDIVIGAYLLVPFDIGGVGGDFEFDEGVLVEKYAGSARIRAEVRGE